MKKKRPFLRIIAVAILVIVIAFLYELNNQFHFFQSNSLTVQVDEHLSSRHVRIRKGFFSGDRANDAEIFSGLAQNGILLFDGVHSTIPESEHGENDFLVMYEGLYYYEFRHIITNSKDKFDYTFSLTKQHDTLYVEVNIEGIHDEHFKQPMALISEAKNNLGNEPIKADKRPDSAIYNSLLSNPDAKKGLRVWQDNKNELKQNHIIRSERDGFNWYTFWNISDKGPALYMEDSIPVVGFMSDTLYDVNGDGYKDLLINGYHTNGSCAPDYVHLFCYDSKTNSFISLPDIYYIPNPRFFPAKKLIKAEISCNFKKDIYVFKWNGFELDTLISKTVDLK